ncbi:PSP1 C-terminal [Penicillium chrysogenum]|uniref:PSP1 C-terminal n=1 Tax=Penicillium chrysogenum TaxID=5076 RepID=UPI0024DF19F2|nr:PSP1 C-terminal [Penicillium chrysogenum]KAJ5244285.1 PSP1 C-terminal [Penicillium chrysogenum]
MAAPSNKPTSMAQSSTPPAAPTASAILEKTHPGVRRSTPDSDALASSDDDGDHGAQAQNIIPPTTRPPVRRSSWLNEVPLSAQRKHSLPGGPLSSAPSNPTSPASDQAPWATTTSPSLGGSFNWNQAGGSPFSWGTGTGIWNTESRKEPPSRLAEMVPSPTMTNPPPSGGNVSDEMLSPITRTISGESAIPFSIPLQPTLKTYRSQSYSVGQMDPEFLSLSTSKAGAAPTVGAQYPGSRPRGPGQMSAVQPRASRPSVLGELGHDTAMLGRVREDDDGDESLNGSESDRSYSASQARQIEQLARENALLRQAAAAGQMDNRYRERAGSAASIGGGHSLHRIRGGVLEGDLTGEDPGELRDITGYNNLRGNSRRRFSEHLAHPEAQFSSFASPLENRALDNVRKAHWQTSLGFGGMPDIPQSRRHSFAEIPMRHGSIGPDSHTTATPRAAMGDRDDGYGNLSDYSNQPYYSREQTLRGDGSSGIPPSLNQYAMSNAYGRQPSALSHAHQNQLLYIVAFKCSRADVFYIQEDTGLQVKNGDLVIVEADRGTDLGTVIHANISLQQARELKQHYAEEHYKTLMLFSRHGQPEGSTLTNPNTGLNTRSATGGMGPHGPHSAQEPTTDIKPKLIKRLAQQHEVLTLHDKEGNEAKAKRVCQQKVVEHRLNMEILDAEFQMDWKKLTFYYFADSYINFNSLVTDLFKIYKTRIWMSAINPASFVTPPTTGLSGPGTMPNPLYGQDADRRHQLENRSYGGARDAVDTGREMPNPVGMLRTSYGESYQPFSQPSRHSEGPAHSDVFAPQASSFGPADSFEYPGNIGASNSSSRVHPAQGEWLNRFQGLSLNS